jgi:hypothetical protein
MDRVNCAHPKARASCRPEHDLGAAESGVRTGSLRLHRGGSYWPAFVKATLATTDACSAAFCDNHGIMRFVLLLASVAAVIGTAAPSYADPDGKDQSFLNALSQAGLTFMNPDRAIAAGKTVCDLANGGMTGEEIVKNLQDRNPGFQGPGAAKFTAIAASAYCPEQLTPADQGPAPKAGGA